MTENKPIRVIYQDGVWKVAYGSYIAGFHSTRAEAMAAATAAAAGEQRELTIEHVLVTGDLARLLVPEFGVTAGTLGTVTGFYRQPTGEVVCVTFETGEQVISLESLELVAPPAPDALAPG